MFFKNLDSGLVWEVVDPDHIKRLKNHNNYEEVKPNETKRSKKDKQSPEKVGE
ncbi:hypothetical protein [Neobacillus cucumis]|uniref:hypothetical protein n=1 Tax=Neobacillus cucumis TaxID=1740721 RepID=UPI0015E0DD3A|nr:hypothetical protein [Neobacillus cucumis]